MMLTVQEAASAVKLTQWAIYRAIKRGDLTAYKPGGRLRIHEVDLQAWLESTKVEPRAAPRLERAFPLVALEASARQGGAPDSLRDRVRAQRRQQAM